MQLPKCIKYRSVTSKIHAWQPWICTAKIYLPLGTSFPSLARSALGWPGPSCDRPQDAPALPRPGHTIPRQPPAHWVSTAGAVGPATRAHPGVSLTLSQSSPAQPQPGWLKTCPMTSWPKVLPLRPCFPHLVPFTHITHRIPSENNCTPTARHWPLGDPTDKARFFINVLNTRSNCRSNNHSTFEVVMSFNAI